MANIPIHHLSRSEKLHPRMASILLWRETRYLPAEYNTIFAHWQSFSHFGQKPHQHSERHVDGCQPRCLYPLQYHLTGS
jgi:hypothetical protein